MKLFRIQSLTLKVNNKLNNNVKFVKTKKAFSLIELIFVIVVIGIISSVAIPKLTNIKTFASASVIKQDINTITASIQSYYLLNGDIKSIDDAVVINPKIWSIDPSNKLELKHIKNGINCIVIDVDLENSELNILVDEGNEVCENIVSYGISTYSFALE
jgi:general secretion pathway protein G